MTDWSAPPKHIVLIGSYGSNTHSGTADTANAAVPTWHLPDSTTAFWWGTHGPSSSYEYKTVPSDDPYVYAPGSSDSIPMLSIGRLPFDGANDLNNYISKVINYEMLGPAAWKFAAVHLAEDRNLDGNDGGIVHITLDSLSIRYGGRENYFARSTLAASTLPPSGSSDNSLPVIQAWNGGLGFVLALGTGGDYLKWGFFGQPQGCSGPYGCVSGSCDSIHVTYKTPIVLALTCGAGFVSSGNNGKCGTLASHLLAIPNRGAVFLSGPSRAIGGRVVYAIARGWFLSAFALTGPPVVEPGAVIRSAKAAAIPLVPGMATQCASILALGDPALQMPVGAVTVGLESVPLPEMAIKALQSPSRDLRFAVQVPSPGAYTVRLYNVQGREVAVQHMVVTDPRASAIAAFSSPAIRSGVYFAMVTGPSLSASTKTVFFR